MKMSSIWVPLCVLVCALEPTQQPSRWGNYGYMHSQNNSFSCITAPCCCRYRLPASDSSVHSTVHQICNSTAMIHHNLYLWSPLHTPAVLVTVTKHTHVKTLCKRQSMISKLSSCYIVHKRNRQLHNRLYGRIICITFTVHKM